MGAIRKEETITAAEALSFLTLLLRFDYLRLWISSTKTPPLVEYLHKEYIKEQHRIGQDRFASILENLRKVIRTDCRHRLYFIDLPEYRTFFNFARSIYKSTPNDEVHVEADTAFKIRNGRCFSRNVNWASFIEEWNDADQAVQETADEKEDKKTVKESENKGEKEPKLERNEYNGRKDIKKENFENKGEKEMHGEKKGEDCGKKEPKSEKKDGKREN